MMDNSKVTAETLDRLTETRNAVLPKDSKESAILLEKEARPIMRAFEYSVVGKVLKIAFLSATLQTGDILAFLACVFSDGFILGRMYQESLTLKGTLEDGNAKDQVPS